MMHLQKLPHLPWLKLETSAEPNTATSQVEPPSLGSTIGALLIATFLGLILLGVILHQAYRYARNFRNDPSWLKGLVALTV
ncbi:hypothetical protein C2E23DRAFT_598649 [Lenzites betulinus]|nr:hypothetical protein C2E23DRAFT_598649 [Lenzites betulinus]